MIELEPETMTAAPRTGADFAENGQMSEIGKTFRRLNPAAGEAARATNPAPVQIETPEEVFRAAVQAINKRFQPGTLEYIRDHFPEMAEEISRAFDRLNNTWGRWTPGANLEPFKRALRTWYNLHIKAIELFQETTK